MYELSTGGIGTYSNNKILSDEMITEWSGMDVISIDDLIDGESQWSKFRDSHGRAISICRAISGMTSILSSCTLIWMIVRSYKGLSTTQHRLLLGLCICDIFYSWPQTMFNIMSPAEMNYYVWNARGNVTSCVTQGFFIVLGSSCGLFYNCALNFFYLAIIKYEKATDFVRNKMEPFLHIVPVVIGLSWSISLLIKDHLNDDGSGACVSQYYYPPHCQGYDVGTVRSDETEHDIHFDIPCGRGLEGSSTATIFMIIMIFIPGIIIGGSLVMIYRCVRNLERKLALYGINIAARARTRAEVVSNSTNRDPQQSEITTQQKRDRRSSLRSFMDWLLSRSNRSQTASRSNNIQSQKRAVMHKAFGYSFGWFLSYGSHMIGLLIMLSGQGYPLSLLYVGSIFSPLQGFYNLIIFMLPKIISAKNRSRRGESITWWRAFTTAFWSRGKDDRKQSVSSNLRGNRS